MLSRVRQNHRRPLPTIELLPEGVTFSRRKRKLDEDMRQDWEAR
jgi:hypothetical protein